MQSNRDNHNQKLVLEHASKSSVRTQANRQPVVFDVTHFPALRSKSHTQNKTLLRATAESKSEVPHKSITQNAPFILPTEASIFLHKIKSINTPGASRTYLVGGYIRDHLLKKNSYDYDLVTGASLDQIVNQLFEIYSYNLSVKRTHANGIIQVILNDEYNSVIAITHSESLADLSLSDMEARKKDAEMRDFTANALFADENGLYDPTGLGLKNIEEKALVLIGEANNPFKQDPIKMLRLIHFASTLHFNIGDNIHLTLQENLKSLALYSKTNPEKVNAWMHKLLCKGKTEQNLLGLIKSKILETLFPSLGEIFEKSPQKLYFAQQEMAQHSSLNTFYIIFMNCILKSCVDSKVNQSIKHNFMRTLIDCNPLLSANFNNPEKINAWLYGFFTPGKAENNFKWLRSNNMLNILFPGLKNALQINPTASNWLENQLREIDANKLATKKFSLSKIYALIILCQAKAINKNKDENKSIEKIFNGNPLYAAHDARNPNQIREAIIDSESIWNRTNTSHKPTTPPVNVNINTTVNINIIHITPLYYQHALFNNPASQPINDNDYSTFKRKAR